MRIMSPLGHATRELFDQLMEDEKLECSFRKDGYYEIYLTRAGLESAAEDAAFVADYGFHSEIIPGDALREREPAMNRRVLGGIFYPDAASLNPFSFVRELANRAERHGARVETGADVAEICITNGKVRGVRMQNGESLEAESVVLATGAYSTSLIRRLGLRLPLQAGKGYHRDFEYKMGKPPLLQHACSLGENGVFCTPMDGFVRLSGTLEFSGTNHEMRLGRLEQLTNATTRYLNGMENFVSRSEWCGLRPCISDGLPVVGPLMRYCGLFIATGHAMLGLTLGPVTGKLIAEYILDGSPGLDISGLSPERF